RTTTFVIARAGEARNCELRRAAQARTAGKRKSAHAQIFNNVTAGEGIFRGREFGIAQVPEAKFIQRGGPDNMCVAECECLVADGTQFSVSGKGSRIELVDIVKAVAAEDGVFGTHHLVDPKIELIKIIRSCAAIEIVLAWIAVGAKTTGSVGQRIE